MADTKERGLTGLLRTSTGTVSEEFLPDLQGANFIKVAKQMRDNDPVVGAMLFAIDMLVRGVDWEVHENPDADDSEGDAKFLEEAKDDMSHTWPDFISEVFTMLPFGWSFFEIVYKIRNGPQDEDRPNSPASSDFTDGKVGWRKFAIRAQESLTRWQFDDAGGIQGMYQSPAPKYEEIFIPMPKGLLFRTVSHKGNPEGRSVFRNAYRPWYYKNRIEVIEGTGIERDLAGMPMAGVDPAILLEDADAKDKQLLDHIENVVQNVKRDKQEGIVWPNQYDESGNKLYTFELLSSGGARTFDTSAIIERYDRRIAMTILADFILLGHENVGSFALSSDKTDLFAVALGAWLDAVQAVINMHAVKRLFKLNGMQTEHLPTIEHGDIEDRDLAELVAYVGGLVAAGMPMFPDDNLEKELRQIGHLPEKSEEAMQAQQQAQDQQQQQGQPGQDQQQQNQPPPTNEQDANTRLGAGRRGSVLFQGAGSGNGNGNGRR